MRPRARFVLVLATLALAAAGASGGERETGAIPSSTIDRKGYTLRYPSAWKLDTADSDFDLDSYFAIDISAGCHVAFFFFDTAIDPAHATRGQIERHREKFFKPGSTVARFTRWGAYRGEGAHLRGTLRPIGAGDVRVFAWTTAERAVQVIEFCYAEDLPAAKPGLALVESSFRLK
jgi:hypothetical protein